MTICLYLNGGVPIVITDTLQSKSASVTYSPENCDFIYEPGRLKSIRNNENGENNVVVGQYPLVRKWKLFSDNVVIAFSGSKSAVDWLIQDYGSYISNADASGEVITKLDCLSKKPSSPKFGFTVVAPSGDWFHAHASGELRNFHPFTNGRCVGSGAEYIYDMYHCWWKTQINTPSNFEDRMYYIMIAREFVEWLNAIHTTSKAPYALRRYRKKNGRTFGGFFQGIYFSPEDGRWLDLQKSQFTNYARISRSRCDQHWVCRKTVREVRNNFDREIHTTFRHKSGKIENVIFPIKDPFGDFVGFDNINLPSPAQFSFIGVDGSKPVKAPYNTVQINNDMKMSLAASLEEKIFED